MLSRRPAALPALALVVICVLAAVPCCAQKRTANPAGLYQSFTQWLELDPGIGTAMVTDASGNAYIAVKNPPSGGYVAKVAPDGSVLYNTAFSDNPYSLALGDAGSVWVGGVGKFSSQGIPVSRPSLPFAAPIASDQVGNLYGVTADSSYNIVVVKTDASGNPMKSFDTKVPGYANAIAVDASGAVYVAGGAGAAGFPATPGALHSGTGTNTHVFALKVSPGLDSLVYAALIGGSGTDNAAVMAVDSAGDAWIAGSATVAGYPDLTPFPLTDIGLPPGDVDAFVLKLSPDGSSLLYSAGLGSGSVISLAALSDGRVQALATMNPIGEGIFTLTAARDALESEQFLPERSQAFTSGFAVFANGAVACAPGANGTLRALMTTRSELFPVIDFDEDLTPLLVDFAASPPAADLSVSLTQPQPNWNSYLSLHATVTNSGPAEAEFVQVQLTPPAATSEIGCAPGGIAICMGHGGALIPQLAAGASISLDFLFYPYQQFFEPEEQGPLLLSAVALTSDVNTANNLASLTPQVINGTVPNILTDPPGFFFYRSDAPGSTTLEYNEPSADPSLSVWVPSPQNWGDNFWYFQSWYDGNTDNPRTFDATNGVPFEQGEINFRPASPVGLFPSSLDFVALPGSAPQGRSVALSTFLSAGQIWSLSLGQPDVPWVTLSLDTAASTVSGTANLTGLAPGYYTTTVPLTLHVQGLPDASVSIPVSLRIMDKPPVINTGGIVNAASYQGAFLAPGEIVTIFGSGLGPPQLVQAPVPVAGTLPWELAGTTIYLGLVKK